MKLRLIAAAAVAAATLTAAPIVAADYPDRPVSLMVS